MLPSGTIRVFREAHILYVDGLAVALGGLLEHEGRRFVVLDVTKGCEAYGLKMLLAMRRMIRAQSGKLYVQCQQQVYPQAPRLLTCLGFTPTDELLNGAQVWEISRS